MKYSIRGSTLLTDEPVELILAGAVIFVLFVSVYMVFFSASRSPADTAAENYFDTFIRQLGEVSSDTSATFSFFQKVDGASLYLIYFNKKSLISIEDAAFLNPKREEVCVCTLVKETPECNYCGSIDSPVYLNGALSDSFTLSFGEQLEMNFSKGAYHFTKGAGA